MDYDIDKASELALALLYLTLHDKSPFDESCSAWKGLDFDVMNYLHERGLIQNPINKNKSVVVTSKGVKKAEAMYNKFLKK